MRRTLVFSILIVAVVSAGAFLLWPHRGATKRSAEVFAWIRDPAANPGLVITAGAHCNNAPFMFPTTGVPGYIWDDMFQPGHRHQGVDIFAGTDIDVTPVIAVYDGYLTRLRDWKSSVIIRIPNDPLQPGRQIWVYYTHMADEQGNSFISAEFPPGTYDKPVEAGVLLGHQGDYSGDPNNPVGVHLHISVVKDSGGNFMNELDIKNTYDPSPYLGLALNAHTSPDAVPSCNPASEAQP